MLHFLEGGDNAHEVINTVPKEKLILLDKNIDGVTGDYAVIYEDFANDIYKALGELKDELSKIFADNMRFLIKYSVADMGRI